VTASRTSRRTLALLLVLVALAACVRMSGIADAVADRNPFRSFDSRCEALPDATVEVRVEPVDVLTRYDLSHAALATRHEAGPPGHRTVGLTEVALRHESSLRFAVVEDRRGHACVRPSVSVSLAATPVVVRVASEYRGDPCREPLILAHEERHVDVYRRFLDGAGPALSGALRERIGTRPHYGSSSEEVSQRLDAAIRDDLGRFMADAGRELRRRNALVDTPESYAEMGERCGEAARP